MAPPSLPRPPGRPTGASRPSSADGPHGAAPLASVPPQVPGPRIPAAPPETRHSGTFDLPATPASVGPARRAVRALLDAWGVDDDTGDGAVLVISELVTNVLTHTGSVRIVCRLHRAGGRLHIEVEDQNGGGPRPARRQPGDDDQNGRGLVLVGALSRNWGVRDTAHGSGHVVWAELACADDGPSPVETEPPATTAASPVLALPAVALPVRAAELPSREVALWSAGAHRPPPWQTVSPPGPVVRP
ncbi:ATP-binding protein [Streptomyces sp. CRN 30]|uniref:ATP-binding protein n=1 Tax=Streptomyces sp. CRN 30 TaxID=3075613 RepID=UPI002A7F4413|nr:ATP-binding protein [Streptomyces sp. CRN 30]